MSHLRRTPVLRRMEERGKVYRLGSGSVKKEFFKNFKNSINRHRDDISSVEVQDGPNNVIK